MRVAIVIMAAGKGTRLKSKRPKVLHEIGGRALVAHVVAAASRIVPPRDIFVVVGHGADQVRSALEPAGVRFILQPEQRGTGHALLVARPEVEQYENLLVLSGDAPMITPETLARLRDFHIQELAAMTILTAAPSDPTSYGRVVRRVSGFPEVQAIVEEKALSAEQKRIREINAGVYAFRSAPLFKHIGELSTSNVHAEYYLTDMAGILVRAHERVLALEASDPSEVLGANTIPEMMSLDAAMRLRKARKLMASGVTIYRPETSVIDEQVTVGPDAILEPFVQLLGNTRIASHARIRSYSVLEDTTVGERALIRQNCVLNGASVEDDVQVGPFAHLRPGAHLGPHARVGNFVEVKNAHLGAGAKANHLSYLGDAEIGAAVNIGAGTITCNYDGSHKHRTVIGAGAFVGSDSTLVAPVVIGPGAYVAAGSTVTEDVAEGALAVGRARQVNKPDWAKRRRPRQGADS